MEHAAADARRTYAVVGSTGKAVTAYVLDHVLAALGRSSAIFSTVEIKVGAERAPVERETVPDLGAFLDRTDDAGVDDTVVELRWPDLAAGALAALTSERAIDIAIFTHLDVDGEASDVLLTEAAELLGAAGRALVLVDDEAGQEVARRVPGAITVGTRPKGQDADWQVTILASRPDHIDFAITHRTGRSVTTSLWIPARFSVGNAALALVAVMETGVTGATIARLLPKGLRPVVPGRAERVADRPRVVVDIAHNPTRLGRVLESLRTTTKGKLTVVVGARPGDSPEVRREIGRAAGRADTVVVTDDDFGTGDDAAAIRADVVAGVREAGRAQVAEVSPRRAAIRGTVALADRDDTVLVAGRGHLTRLLVAGEREHLDDREEVRAGLAQRDGHASAG